jgi:hypothetical protein
VQEQAGKTGKNQVNMHLDIYQQIVLRGAFLGEPDLGAIADGKSSYSLQGKTK